MKRATGEEPRRRRKKMLTRVPFEKKKTKEKRRDIEEKRRVPTEDEQVRESRRRQPGKAKDRQTKNNATIHLQPSICLSRSIHLSISICLSSYLCGCDCLFISVQLVMYHLQTKEEALHSRHCRANSCLPLAEFLSGFLVLPFFPLMEQQPWRFCPWPGRDGRLSFTSREEAKYPWRRRSTRADADADLSYPH